MATLTEMNTVLEAHEASAVEALETAEDTDPRAVDEVLAVAAVHATLAQVAATKMAVTVLMRIEAHLTKARTIGW